MGQWGWFSGFSGQLGHWWWTSRVHSGSGALGEEMSCNVGFRSRTVNCFSAPLLSENLYSMTTVSVSSGMEQFQTECASMTFSSASGRQKVLETAKEARSKRGCRVKRISAI